MIPYNLVNDEFDETNSLKFSLHIICKRKEKYKDYSQEQLLELRPEEYLINSTVFADQIKWVPLGNQASTFADQKPRVLFEKIIVAKLRENQEVEIDLYCTKNIGSSHTKWSPVSTAYYRLKPLIEFVKPITGKEVLLT